MTGSKPGAAPQRTADLADGTSRRETVRVERVTFHSSGVVLVGDLYLPGPADGPPRPAVVVAGAWATVKEQMAAGYAREMADRGYVALAFDFRTWGQSGGQPRSVEDPVAKAADIAAAAEFLAQLPAVDPDAIVGLGICAGSSYLIAAAIESPLIQSLALIAPALPTRDDVRENLGGEQNLAAFVDAAEQAWAEYERSGTQTLMPAVPPGSEDPTPGGDYYTNANRGRIPEWDNTFNLASWSKWIPFDVHAYAPALTQPLLVVHSDAAVKPDSVRAFVARVPASVIQLWLDGTTQFDFYDQPQPMALASTAAAEHFARSVAEASPPRPVTS